MTAAMTGAELKTVLGGLGLPPTWFGQRCGVTMRTVVRWFDGDEVAPEVAEEVRNLAELTLGEMREALEEFNGHDVTDAVTLRTFRTDAEFAAFSSTTWPASWHRALTFRVMEHLRAQDVDVRVEYA